ncbi:unnamed protein product [Orchesella dallaii]|uniref:Patronin n=1 Tax=Orchesella dallaii TaxID=48710 RepID=A0ABP1S6M1_9HEXA
MVQLTHKDKSNRDMVMTRQKNGNINHNNNNIDNETGKATFRPQAKQRTTIKWLLSKAYNNKIPEELAEPFYKDHEGEEHLKPHIVQGLSNAELYCLSLCNIYADPNYSQLSPWGIVQALARKGSYVQTPSDIQLTETVLIQNTPLKIAAHMVVIEAMMVLQVREIISNERVVNTVQRYGPNVHPREMPSDAEEALLLWINRAVLAIKEYIQNNNAHEHNLTSPQVESWTQLPLFQDLTDLADGVGLCSLLAFYCQEELALSEISVPNPGEPLSVSDSLWNLQLVHRVCRDSLPYNVCHFTFEDVLYLHESMKQNMLNFLADLFNQLELHPASCVKLLGSHQMVPIRPADRNALSSRPQSATSTPKRQFSVKERSQRSAQNIFGDQGSSGRRSPSNASVVSVPLRRSTTPHDYSDRAHSEKSVNQKDQRYYAHSRSSEESEDFVVHRGRNVPTLSQVIRSVSPSSQDERSSPASRMSVSRNVSANENEPEPPPAGRPSDWKANKTTYAGRRSRRNSITEADSQLTVENFGGSQDNLNKYTIGRNPDKQPAIVTDSTSSPIRYVRRQSSQEPADYYNDSQSHSQTPPQTQSALSMEPPKRASVCESSGSGGDVVFFGKKKLSVAMDNHQQEWEENMRRGTSEDPNRGQPSGNFNHFQSQNHLNTSENNNHQGSKDNMHQAPSENGNLTVYVMNNSNEGSGNMPVAADAPLRSLSMTNLSRLSDLPNKPINIVYLQSSESSPSTPPVNPNPPPPVSHSYRVSSSNGWSDGSQYASPDYHTLPAAPRAPHQYNYNTPPHYTNPPHQQHQQQQQQSPYHHPQQHHPQQYSAPPSGPQSHHHSPQYHPQQQQQQQQQHHRYSSPHGGGNNEENQEDFDTDDIAAQLNAIRFKLEEKRKRIEMEKTKMETIATKQQAKLGKAAYLKALNKDLENKWLAKTDEPCRTPEIENMDIETYQRSLARMDTSLTELETDIGRLTHQQEQIRRQFFLHGDQASSGAGGAHSSNDTAKRKTWSVPMGGGGGSSNTNVAQPRSQWGSPKTYSDSDNPRETTPPRVTYNGDVRTAAAPQVPPRSASTSSGSGANAGSLSYSSSFRLHSNADTQGNRLFGRQPSDDHEKEHEESKPTPPPRQRNTATLYHAPLPTPPPDDMEPQSVSFVQDDTTPLANELGSMNSKKSSLHQITSGSKTYRITPESGSPPRPTAHRLFTSDAPGEGSLTSSDENPSYNERGFYIALDNEAPKRPKPPLRTRSPAKRRESGSSVGPGSRRDLTTEYIQSIVDRVPIPKDDDEESDQFYQQESGICDGRDKPPGELVIDEKPNMDPELEYQMEKKKERILLQSLKRQQAVEESRRVKEMETQRRRAEEEAKQEEKIRKREEEKARRQAILDSYRMKKQEETDKDTKGGWEVQESSAKKFMRPKSSSSVGTRPRPKTIHLSEVDSGASGTETPRHGALRRSDSQTSSTSLARSYGKRGSSNTLYSAAGGSSRSGVRDPWGSTSSLNQETRRRPTSSYDRRSRPRDLSTSRLEVRSSRRDSYMGSQESLAHRHNSTSSLLDGPGSLPPGLISRRHRGFDDGASDISSVASSNMDYSGLRLYKQPTAKSNRSIILNAVEYCVFPGVVNRDAKMKVLDEINRSESKHFLVMFRDAGCQFRALYQYIPETEEVIKIYGVGPKQVNDRMFEKFFKYNSGGKCFSQVHTKHLTVTIDAFTIHNALWQGKRLPTTKTKDMALVI